jgi:hypothetical protein
MTRIGYDDKLGKFTKEALQQQIRDVIAGTKKIIVRRPKKADK